MVDVIESPDAQDLGTRSSKMIENQVYVRVLRQERNPIRIATSEVGCHSIDAEEGAVCLRE